MTIPFFSDRLRYCLLFLLSGPCFAARCYNLLLCLLHERFIFIYLFITCASRSWSWFAFANNYWFRLFSCKNMLWSFNASTKTQLFRLEMYFAFFIIKSKFRVNLVVLKVFIVLWKLWWIKISWDCLLGIFNWSLRRTTK